MVKREFKAKIVDDFRNKWLETAVIFENSHIDKVVSVYDGPDLAALSKRISGKIVTLIENEYPQGDNDFFEKQDNNHMIHESLFTEI